jgi:very-short-patch-repair endonuclease
MKLQLNNLPYLKETRRYLRKNMTEAEMVLWYAIKDKKLKGRKFRRQHSIGHYIADFYCPSEKLIIELDGQHHFTPEGKKKDIERDTHLALMKLKVLRFENKEVLENLSEVLRKIKLNFNREQPQTPAVGGQAP